MLAVLFVLSVREPPAERPIAETGGVRKTTPLPAALRAYLAILALFSLGNSSDAFLLLRARDLGVPVASLPLLWSVLHTSKLVSSYVGGAFSDRIDRSKVILSGFGVYALTYLGFGVAKEPWQVWALFVVYGSYYGLTEPAEKALVNDLTPIDARGRAYGFYNFVIGATAVPASALTGWLWQTWGAFAALSAGAGIAAMSGVALVVWLWARRPP